MLLIASSLALLVIFAGIKLLAQTQKETLGVFYKCFSWFFIITGFLTLFSIGCRVTMFMFLHKEEQMMERKFRMAEENHFADGFQMRDGESRFMEPEFRRRMWEHHREMMMAKGCDDEMERYRDGYDGMDGECCWKKEKYEEEKMCKKDSIKKSKTVHQVK